MLKFAANLSLLFNEHPFLERFGAAAAAGFRFVEYQFPYEFDPVDVAAAARAQGLGVVLHNLPKNERAACDPAGAAQFRDGVARAIDYARAAGCRQLNCLAGSVPEGVERADVHAALVANLRYAAEETKQADIRLLVEPLNTSDVPGFFLHRTRQAVELIVEVGSDNLFLQYDAYHMQIMEGDLAHTIETHLNHIAHIQVADNPGRHEPGSGEINFPFLFRFLEQLGYAGYIGAEYRPAAGTLAGLGWIRPYLAVQ
jgi:hydroxypyruvate isomerase